MTDSTADQLPQKTGCKYVDLAHSDYKTALNPIAETERDINYMCAFADEQLTTEVMNYAHLARLAILGLETVQKERKRIIEVTDFDGVILNIVMMFNGVERSTEITLLASDAIHLFEQGHRATITDGVCTAITMESSPS